DPGDRYKFRTSPLRNIALQPTFFHNGCFTRLDDAIQHHLNVFTSARNYRYPDDFDDDLKVPMGPIEPVLARVDPLLFVLTSPTDYEFHQLVDFVANALLDDRATPKHLRKLIPAAVPSGRLVLIFE